MVVDQIGHNHIRQIPADVPPLTFNLGPDTHIAGNKEPIRGVGFVGGRIENDIGQRAAVDVLDRKSVV